MYLRCLVIEYWDNMCYLPVIMSIFLLFSAPITSLLYISLEFSGVTAAKAFKKHYFLGVVVFLLSLPVLAVMSYYIPQGFFKIGLFLHHWVFDVLYFSIFALAGYLLLLKKGYLFYGERKDFVFVYTFFSGYFTLVGVYTLIKYFYALDFYLLFLYPLIIVALIFWIPFLVIEALRQTGLLKIVVLLSVLPITFVTALVPALYYLNYPKYALPLAVFILLLCSSVYSIMRNDYKSVFGR